jgi:hypothetical protein
MIHKLNENSLDVCADFIDPVEEINGILDCYKSFSKSKKFLFFVHKNEKLKKSVYLDWNISMPVLHHLISAFVQTAEAETKFHLEVKPA